MADNEFRAGWPRVTSALLGNAIGAHSLPPYTIGLFIGPLQAEFGWSRTSVSAAIAILTIATAIGAPLAGAALNRIAIKPLIASGLVVGAIGYFLLSAMGPSLVVFWSIMGLMALLGSGCAPVTLSHLLVSSFDRRRGVALGISMMGIGLSGALAPVLLGPVIATYGWRAGYVALGSTMACAVPVMLVLLYTGDTRISAVGHREPPSSFSAFRDAIFYRLLAAFFCIAIAVGGIVVHFVPMLSDAGYTASQAAKLASVLGLSLMAGRLLTGFLIDRIFAPIVAATLMSISAAGFLCLFVAGSPGLPFAAALVGLSLGAELDLLAYLVSRYFPSDAYGRTVGLLYSGFLAGVGTSPMIFAGIREQSGGYSLALLWSAALLCVASVLFARLPGFRCSVPGSRLKAPKPEAA